jgi:hypothetical protein
VDGKRYYGDKLYERAEGVLGLDQGQLRNFKSISEKFELSQRYDNLAWVHHREVSSIKTIGTNAKGKLYLTDKSNHGAMQELLQQAEKDKLSTRELADLVSLYKRRQQEEIRLANEPERFAVILADPAWEYDFSRVGQSPDRQPLLALFYGGYETPKGLGSRTCSPYIWG